MKIGIIIVLITILVVRFGVDIIEAQAPSNPFTVSESCTTTLSLSGVPNGLAGFTIRVGVPVEGFTTSAVELDTSVFVLNDMVPMPFMDISGVDLNNVIQAGATNVVLFSVSPCLTEATILILDDDNGDPIVPSGTEVFP